MKMLLNRIERNGLKKIQSRFFSGNVLAQKGHYLTEKEVDELRANVTKPFKSKKFKKFF